VPNYLFWVYRDQASEWRWTLWSWANKKKLADSGEGFSSRASCERNIALIRQVVPTAPIHYHENAR
jgi:uncharacterized protein YegP (UPF0339 family)